MKQVNHAMLKCRACGLRVKLPMPLPKDPVPCPECRTLLPTGAKPAPPPLPPAPAPKPPEPPPPSVFTPAPGTSAKSNVAPTEGADWTPTATVDLQPGRRRWWVWALLLLLLLGGVGALVVIPVLLPKDPRSVVLANYLKAVREGRLNDAAQLGVLNDPPKTASMRFPQPIDALDQQVRDSFARIAFFYRKLREGGYNREGHVFIKREMTDKLAQLIDMKEEINRPKPEPETPPKRKPRDELDEAVEFAENYLGNLNKLVNVVQGGPTSKSIVITVKQALEQFGPDLTDADKEFIDRAETEREKWRRLIGKEPSEIDAEGEYTWLTSTLETQIWLPTQSTGEPPKRVQFEMVRFQIGLLDSGWKVWRIVKID